MDRGEHRNAPGGNGEGCESGVEGVDLTRQFAEWFLQREFPRSGVSCSRFIYFMRRTSQFIDRDVFAEILAEVRRVDGTCYEDVETIYGDMSRLVVAWLASTQPKDLRLLYNKLGWGGNANARAIHEAAKVWLAKHRPGKPPIGRKG